VERSWPPYVDEHSVEVAVPPDRAWPVLLRHVDHLLRAAAASPVTLLLGTRPREGFAVVAEEPPTRLTLAGHHRFSRYVLDLRLEPVAAGSRVVATTYAEFPGLHGRGYRLLVVSSRLHRVATRRLLRSLQERM